MKFLKKYGGWYIDFDYDVVLDVKLENLVDLKEDLPIFLEFDRKGFIYSPKNHKFLYDEELLNYLPQYPSMIEFNKAMSRVKNKYIIPIDLVGGRGKIYREESILSFYNHKNFNKVLKKDRNGFYLEYDDGFSRKRRETTKNLSKIINSLHRDHKISYVFS